MTAASTAPGGANPREIPAPDIIQLPAVALAVARGVEGFRVRRALVHMIPAIIGIAALTLYVAMMTSIPVGTGNGMQLRFGSLWLLVALGEVLTLFVVVRTRQIRTAYFGIVTACCGALAFIALLESAPGNNSLVAALLMAGFFAVSLHAPLPARVRIGLAIVYFVFALIGSIHQGQAAEAYAVLAIFVVVVCVAERRRRLRDVLMFLQSRLASVCESASLSAVELLRFLSVLARECFECRLVLVGYSSGESEMLSAKILTRTALDPIVVRALLQQVTDQKLEQGYLSLEQLGEQFDTPLRTVFRFRPRGLYFYTADVVRGSREERAAVFIPERWWTKLARASDAFMSVRSLFAIGRMSLAATRSRFHTSDLLLMSQQAVTSQEEEVGELIHFVNNASQDIALGCEEVRQNSIGENPRIDLTLSHIRTIEAAARGLSAAVSDLRRMRELARLRKFPRHEEVLIAPVLDELEMSGAYALKRRGATLLVERAFSPDTYVRVISRDFLEAVLRAIVRELADAQPGLSSLSFSVGIERGELAFQFVAGIPQHSLAEKLLGTHAVSRASGGEMKPPTALETFAVLSGGSISVQPREGKGAESLLVLRLPIVEKTAPVAISRGDWLLFVDDNAQVLSFYGRIAEALSLRFHTAGTLGQVDELLAKEGQPIAVFTDVQIGEESGVDVVKKLRERFGKDLPIVVVSGIVEEAVREQVMIAGATKFLSKPVGRARVVAELQIFCGPGRGRGVRP